MVKKAKTIETPSAEDLVISNQRLENTADDLATIQGAMEEIFTKKEMKDLGIIHDFSSLQSTINNQIYKNNKALSKYIEVANENHQTQLDLENDQR